MHSIRTKTMMLTVCAMVVAVAVATLISVISIKNVGHSTSDQQLLLLCQTGERDLDYYFDSVEQSVEMVSTFVRADLEEMKYEDLADHVDRVRAIFEKAAYRTNGVLTFYYRLDPAFSDTVKGFWYVNLDGNGFQEHEVTDITLYDTDDQSALVWFTVPKATGMPIWLPPYITDNLDVRVISYNVPIYWRARFIGVIGIEIDYTTMAQQVDSIRLYDNGYAFINDDEGNIIYHPRIDVLTTTEETRPKVPFGLVSENTFVRYSFQGVEKQAVWLPLSNGMRLNVTVPISEINADWQRLILEIIIASAVVLVVVSIIILRFTGQITKPLRQLTKAAERVNDGDYDVELEYSGNDEVGLLTGTFKGMVNHLKEYISDLNSMAYGDALTSVHNKGAFDIYTRELQTRLSEPIERPEFAVAIFDCDDLKSVNDEFGHDKGDIFLKTASHLLCNVFQHSPVFRIGGDEFAVVLQGDDYRNREALTREFEEKSAGTDTTAENPWERVSVTMGLAVYDPATDQTVNDVARRADKLMYEHKYARKAVRNAAI